MEIKSKICQILAALRISMQEQGRILPRYKMLQNWVEIDENEIDNRNLELRKNIINVASQYSPFYQERFEGESSKLIDNWEKIPLLDKKNIREHLSRIKVSTICQNDVYANTSGGSTGEPVTFYQDRDYLQWRQAGKILYDSWCGYQPGMPKFVLWGSERDIFNGSVGIRGKVGHLVRNQKWFNAFSMSEEKMLLAVQQINKMRPVQILAYAESLYMLAGFIQDSKLQVFSPKAIMVSAGTLFPHMRERLEKVFCTKVYNRYGSREAGDIACSYDGSKEIYVNPATHYVEIIREDGSLADRGEEGEIVITVLRNHCMPLIRYRIGDVGAWAEEGFRRKIPWPCLLRVSGRVSDIFINNEGHRIHGEYFTHLLYHRSWVKTFQIIQETRNKIVVKVVAHQEVEIQIYESFEREIREKTKAVMGLQCQVEFIYPNAISPSPSGKYRYTVSNVVENN